MTLTRQIMTDISEYLIFLPKEQVLVCGSCKYALSSEGVHRHFQRTHKAIPLQVRKKLVDYTKTLSLCSPNNVEIPTGISHGFDCLKLIKGFCCSTCGELCGTELCMKEHWKKHGPKQSNAIDLFTLF